VTVAAHVHHVNEVKDDNRPSNLAPLEPAEHAALHGHDPAPYVALHSQGLNTVEIADALGSNPGTVWRILRRAGVSVPERGVSQRAAVDAAEVERMFAEGMRPATIGAALGVSHTPIRRILRERGIPAHAPGRPRG
jgi:DNA-binding CsgD family transcriptional regulator